MEPTILYLTKASLLSFCVLGFFPRNESTDIVYEYEGDCGLRLTTPMCIKFKRRTRDKDLDIDDMTEFHLLGSEFTPRELRKILPHIWNYGVPIYVYSTLNDFKNRRVECANYLPINEEYKARFRSDDPVLDIHAWLYLMASATKSKEALTEMVQSPKSKHVKELIAILEHTKGSSHALMQMKSRLHRKFESIEEFGDINEIEDVEYSQAQRLRELMVKQRLTTAKLPEFLYHAIRNLGIKEHTT